MNTLVVAIISIIFGVIYLKGKFWVYDDYSESSLSDAMKLIYFITDAFKDLVVIYLILKYLLYGTLF